MEKYTPVAYPRVRQREDGLVEIIVYHEGKRMRLQNGKRFGINFRPNSFPEDQRLDAANELAAKIFTKMLEGHPTRQFRSNQGRSPERQEVRTMAIFATFVIAILSVIFNLLRLWILQ